MLQHTDFGYIKVPSANSNDFKYELVITSINPTTGIKAGGTEITITGTNFSPQLNRN